MLHKRCDIKNYLDSAIDEWRVRREEAESVEMEAMASHYIDAYQSVRISIFDEPHPE